MRSGILIVATIAGAFAAPPNETGQRQATELMGRSAGTPQRCILIEPAIGFRVADGDRGTLLYGTGRRIWASHLKPGCGFNRGDVLVVETIGSDYCRGDFVRSFDPVSRFAGPSCTLGEFIPYTR